MADRDGVTLSTKCWEGDYRQVLDPQHLSATFAPFGQAARRQVVLNTVTDRHAAEQLARRAVAAGSLDAWCWAEDLWPDLSARLGVHPSWFGPAWGFSVPELVELDSASTPLVLHLAGDVRLALPAALQQPWLERALPALDGAAVASPSSPSRVEWTRPAARPSADGWLEDGDFSDQCFLARRTDLLRPEVLRAVHPAAGRYPKPGGALTFEARVGCWLRSSGAVRRIDLRHSYEHRGDEGASYAALAGPAVAPASVTPPPGPARLSAGVGVVVARDAQDSIGYALASLQWLQRCIVLDQQSTDATAAVAASAGAEVRTGPSTGTGRAALPTLLGTLDPAGWVVLLHADEVAPPALVEQLAAALAETGLDAVEVSRRTYVLGRPEPGVPDRQLRAFRPGRVVLPVGVEALRRPIRPVRGASVRALGGGPDLTVLRLRTPDLHAWLRRANDRTTLGARGTELPARPAVARVARALLRELARREPGETGDDRLRRATLAALERWLLVGKVAESAAGGGVAVQAYYAQLAEAVLAGEPPGVAGVPAERGAAALRRRR